MIEISRDKFLFASIEILSQCSKQLKAMSIMSLFSSKCCDFSFVKITMNDFIRASLRSADCLLIAGSSNKLPFSSIYMTSRR